MSSNVSGMEKHGRTLRAWQLAILRFAVTFDNADRLAVLMIAAELDGLGPGQGTRDRITSLNSASFGKPARSYAPRFCGRMNWPPRSCTNIWRGSTMTASSAPSRQP